MAHRNSGNLWEKEGQGRSLEFKKVGGGDSASKKATDEGGSTSRACQPNPTHIPSAPFLTRHVLSARLSTDAQQHLTAEGIGTPCHAKNPGQPASQPACKAKLAPVVAHRVRSGQFQQPQRHAATEETGCERTDSWNLMRTKRARAEPGSPIIAPHAARH
ncbi:hypothetical protein ACLOJK_038686 [Asimina triloba]